MKFQTESGSIYEIDESAQKIRRLQGNGDPTPRIGKDGEWRVYSSIFPAIIQTGLPLMISWGANVDYLPETKAYANDVSSYSKTTITSDVVRIFD